MSETYLTTTFKQILEGALAGVVPDDFEAAFQPVLEDLDRAELIETIKLVLDLIVVIDDKYNLVTLLGEKNVRRWMVQLHSHFASAAVVTP